MNKLKIFLNDICKHLIICFFSFLLSNNSFAQTEMNRTSSESYKSSILQLEGTINRILALYSNEQDFIEAFKISNRDWSKYRDAQLKMKFPSANPRSAYGSVFQMCYDGYLEELTRIRIKELRAWSDGGQEGDVCIGSVKSKDNLSGNNKEEVLNLRQDKVFDVVQIPAEFPGGLQGWTKFLEQKLNRDVPIKNKAPIGKYTVIVSFIVDMNGAISELKAENDPGYGTKEEAVRVMKNSPSWKAAIQNGVNVPYRHKQSITFVVSDK